MYRVTLSPAAEKFLRKLDRAQQIRVGNKLLELERHADLGKPLCGPLAGCWSLRIGQYRAVYCIQEQQLLVLVLRIGHRKNAYD